MKNIAIFDTALASSNVGDEIIMDAVSRHMERVFEEHFSLRLATHVNNFSCKQMLHRNSKIRYFQNADWKFICGTNLIAQNRLGKINSQWQLYPSNLSVYKNCILIALFISISICISSLKMTRILDIQVKRICEHRVHLLLQFLWSIRKIYAVTKRL